MFEVKVQKDAVTTTVRLIEDGTQLAASIFNDSMRECIDKTIKDYERYAVASMIGDECLKVGVHIIRLRYSSLTLQLWQHQDGEYTTAMTCEPTIANLEVLKQIASIAKFAEFNEQD